MTELKALRCPSCGARLKVPSYDSIVECAYCGNDIKVSHDRRGEPKAVAEIENTIELPDEKIIPPKSILGEILSPSSQDTSSKPQSSSQSFITLLILFLVTIFCIASLEGGREIYRYSLPAQTPTPVGTPTPILDFGSSLWTIPYLPDPYRITKVNYFVPDGKRVVCSPISLAFDVPEPFFADNCYVAQLEKSDEFAGKVVIYRFSSTTDTIATYNFILSNLDRFAPTVIRDLGIGHRSFYAHTRELSNGDDYSVLVFRRCNTVSVQSIVNYYDRHAATEFAGGLEDLIINAFC